MFTVNDFMSFQVHGGGHGGGIAGLLNNFLIFADGLAGKSGDEMFALIFPGIAALNNLHPLVVHFPIALLVLFFVAESIAVWRKNPNWQVFATGLLYAGTLFAALTVFLGFQAASNVAHDEVVHGIMERHETLGVSVLVLALLLSVWRWFAGRSENFGIQLVFLVFAGVMNILLFFGADLGGFMVYNHGVAVNAVLPSLSNYAHQHEAGVAAEVQLESSGHSHEHSHSHTHGEAEHTHE